jgi:hypothetical protein
MSKAPNQDRWVLAALKIAPKLAKDHRLGEIVFAGMKMNFDSASKGLRHHAVSKYARSLAATRL